MINVQKPMSRNAYAYRKQMCGLVYIILLHIVLCLEYNEIRKNKDSW